MFGTWNHCNKDLVDSLKNFWMKKKKFNPCNKDLVKNFWMKKKNFNPYRILKK